MNSKQQQQQQQRQAAKPATATANVPANKPGSKAATVAGASTLRQVVKADASKKVTFKSVLDSPFNVTFPVINREIQQQIYERLLSDLQPVAEHRKKVAIHVKQQKKQQKLDRKRKRSDKEQEEQQQQQQQQLQKQSNAATSATQSDTAAIPRIEIPEEVKALVTGINKTYKVLSLQHKLQSGSKKPDQPAASNPIRLVFICKPDISPPQLIAHVPVATYLAGSETHPIYLIQLPKESSVKLGALLRIGHCASMIAIRTKGDVFRELLEMVEKHVTPMDVPWLKMRRDRAANTDSSEPQRLKITSVTTTEANEATREAKRQRKDKKKQSEIALK